MEPFGWVAIASIAIACFAAWQSFRSTRTARKAYQLALQQDRRLQPAMELYIVDSYIRRLTTKEARVFLFKIVVTNKSDVSNSLREIQLVIEHRRGHGPFSNIIIQHSPDTVSNLSDLSEKNIDLLRIPCSIAEHGVLGGIVIFEVPDDILQSSTVESYTIKVVDSYGRESELETILLLERNDAEKMEKNDHSSAK